MSSRGPKRKPPRQQTRRTPRPAARSDTPRFGKPTFRSVAAGILMRYDEGTGNRSAPFITELVDDALRTSTLEPQDRRLVTEITLGIIRRRRTLEKVLNAYVTRGRERIETPLWRLLELGACQLLLMESIPSHAAVNETVQLAAKLGRPDWKGLLNGVLRSIDRDTRAGVFEPGTPLESGTPFSPGRCDVPVITLPDQFQEDRLIPGVTYRRLVTPLFPDPADDLAAWLADAFSFPDWIIDDWLDRHGPEEAERLTAWFNTPGMLSLRVNLRRISPDALLARLHESGIAAVASPALNEGIRLARSVRVADLPGFSDGLCSIQDESAMHAARLLAPSPGEQILDLCAAPGGKTTHLAEIMQDDGAITACDVSAPRLLRVAQAADRLGLTSITCQVIDTGGTQVPPGPFDAALLDVPCSNTGVLGKRPDVRWRLSEVDFKELTTLQTELLTIALSRVRTGGRIVYSTCSIDPRENEELVRALCAREPGISLEREQFHRPGFPGDGGYQALLRKA